MWKAAFSGRSETGSVSGRSSSSRKKSKSEKSTKDSIYEEDEGRSTYATAPSSRVAEPRSLTESAIRTLSRDDNEWEDDEKDARSERRSVRSDGKRHRRRSEKERERSRSRSGSREKSDRRKSSSRKSRPGVAVDGGDKRSMPHMGSFSQFPGQYAGGNMASAGGQDPMMSGALPSMNNQFGPTRSDSYGHAADYYGDEGQSVYFQPGVRAKSPNMLVNPDLDHLQTASAVANPVADTGNGSAADFYSGRGPVFTEEPESINPGGSYSSGSGKPSKKSSRTASVGTAANGIAMRASGNSSSQRLSQTHTSSTSYQHRDSTTVSQYNERSRDNDNPVTLGENASYYGAPPQQNADDSGKQSSHTNSGLYAAGAAAAGFTAYEMNQRQQQSQNAPSVSAYGGTQFATSSLQGQQRLPQMNGGNATMAQQHFHEHKGPLTRLKDGLFNLISNEEDTIKMEMYTEYIGVCKYCFDPRTSPYDAPRRHHYHSSSRNDSFEELRKRRSIERMRKGSREYLGRTASTRVDKDSRYYSSDRRKSSSKTELVGAGIAAAGVAAGANALFNSGGKDFDDTYSVKSGHRESSAVRRRSRSSSREKRRRSTHGVVGRDSKDEYVTIRTTDGRAQRRKVQRSRSTSRDRKVGLTGAATGAAIGATAIAAGRSRWSRDHTPNGSAIRRRSGSRSSSHSPEGFFGSFFSPPRRKRRASRPDRQKKQGGFFGFGNDSFSSSDEDLAFGASKTDLALRRKPSMKSTRRKNSDEHIAATVAGIGATAAALAAAQKGQRLGNRTSRPQLGARRDVKTEPISSRHGPHASEDEWEDELPSDVEDASSVGDGLAFGEYEKRPGHRQSIESLGSQSSGAGGLSAWGWRWGGKDKPRKRRATAPRPETSIVGPSAAGFATGALAGAAFDAARRQRPDESVITSPPSIPQQPMQYVDPRPISDAGSLPGSRHVSMPGAFDSSPIVARPGPAPLQQPKPVAPIQPAFTQTSPEVDVSRPVPRRTQSSPTQSSFAQDAALIGAAAVGTAAVIASQRRKSKDVRFGLTEEQERRHDRERREQEQPIEEERRRSERTSELKREADRHSREQDVLRARELENRRAAEAEVERQRSAQREAEEQAEIYRQRELEARAREESYKREQAITEEIERKKRELIEQERQARDQRTQERRQYERQEEDSSKTSSVPWGAVAAGAAGTGIGVAALAEHEQHEDEERNSRSGSMQQSRETYETQEVRPQYSTRGRSPDYNRQVDELARKAAGKVIQARNVVAETDAYYNEPVRSQAEVFAPTEILNQPSEGKTKVSGPIDDMLVYDVEHFNEKDKFERAFGNTLSGRKQHAPYGVPGLNLISPTPPPSTLPRKSATFPSTAPARGEDAEPQAGDSARKSSRSRSVSWGADQTHVYDVPTPEPQHDQDAYIQSHDIPPTAATMSGVAAAAAAAADAGSVDHETTEEPVWNGENPQKPSSGGEEAIYGSEGSSLRHTELDDDVDDIDESEETPPLQQQPFFESVSDMGFDPFRMDSPGTEGAPPVRGFVEGETDEPTPAEEKSPHVPGGFEEEDYEEPSRFSTSDSPPEVPTAKTAAEAAVEPSVTSSVPQDAEVGTEEEPLGAVDESWQPPLSKKENKRREKAAKRGDTTDVEPDPRRATEVEDSLPAQDTLDDTRTNEVETTHTDPVIESSQDTEREVEPAVAWEPPLSKKEKKKRDKAARKQGFVDVAEAIMTTGGVAAVADAESDTKESSKIKKAKRGKTRGVERDIRDIEPTTTIFTKEDEPELTGMPGSWDTESHDKEAGTSTEVIDPFQDPVDEDSATSLPSAPSTGVADTRIPMARQDNISFHEAAISSPLKPLVSVDEIAGEITGLPSEALALSNGHLPQGHETDTIDVPTTAVRDLDYGNRMEYEKRDRDLSNVLSSSTTVDTYPDTSELTEGYQGKPISKEEGLPDDLAYYDEPGTYDETRSTTTSEPADVYKSSKKSKRKSRREDKTTASTVSSRSEREKDQASSGTKDKKGGFFGLFNRKSNESLSKSEVSSSSRRTTRDSKDGQIEGEEPTSERRRKHRDSDYGSEDGYSVASESKSGRHRSRDDLNGNTRKDQRSGYYDDEHGEDDYRYGQDRRTDDDDDDYTLSREGDDSGRRHRRKRPTTGGSHDDEQSFLGMRVEDLPPLPASPPLSLDSALVKREQDIGSLASAELDIATVSRHHAEAFDLLHQGTGNDGSLARSESSDIRDFQYSSSQPPTEDEIEHLPALPESRPESPTAALEWDIPQRPSAFQRPTSSRTSVPLRFPFGHQPLTSTPRMERAVSFGGSLPSSPLSPMSAQKARQGRPGSTEIRPLYLVERNRKVPEVEEMLPSLPSSKPSSRASSMVGSDEYDSAPEDIGSPDRRRELAIDTSYSHFDDQDDDYLDSQQTTPRATEFPPQIFEKPPRQEPQFYTWEDFAREERLRSSSTGYLGDASPVGFMAPDTADQQALPRVSEGAAQADSDEELPELPLSRPDSPTLEKLDTTAGVAAIAAMGSGAPASLQTQSEPGQIHDDGKDRGDTTTVALDRSRSVKEGGEAAQGPGDLARVLTLPSREPSVSDGENFLASEQAVKEGPEIAPFEMGGMDPALETPPLDRSPRIEEQMEESILDTEEQKTGANVDTTSISGASIGELRDDSPHRNVPGSLSEEQQPIIAAAQDIDFVSTSSELVRPEAQAPSMDLTEEDELTGQRPTALVGSPSAAPEEPDVDQFFDLEERIESGEADSLELEKYTPGPESADLPQTPSSITGERDLPLASEPATQTAEVKLEDTLSEQRISDDEEFKHAITSPKLTKKQSKKAKKKVKAISKREFETLSTSTTIPASTVHDSNIAETSADRPSVLQETKVHDPSAQAPSLETSVDGDAIFAGARPRDSEGGPDLRGIPTLANRELATSPSPTSVLESKDVTEPETSSDKQDRSDPVQNIDAIPHEDSMDKPSSQLEQDETWEPFAAVSRKKSKKAKKEQKKRQWETPAETTDESVAQSSLETTSTVQDDVLFSAPSAVESMPLEGRAVPEESTKVTTMPADMNTSQAIEHDAVTQIDPDVQGKLPEPVPSNAQEHIVPQPTVAGIVDTANEESLEGLHSTSLGVTAKSWPSDGLSPTDNDLATRDLSSSRNLDPTESISATAMEPSGTEKSTQHGAEDTVLRDEVSNAQVPSSSGIENDNMGTDETSSMTAPMPKLHDLADEPIAPDGLPASTSRGIISSATADTIVTEDAVDVATKDEQLPPAATALKYDNDLSIDTLPSAPSAEAEKGVFNTALNEQDAAITGSEQLASISSTAHVDGQKTWPEVEPEAEFAWASSKKKGKKGKKAKKSVTTTTAKPTEPENVLQPQKESIEEAVADTTVPSSSTAVISDDQSRHAEDPESFWEMLPSKKKKGKKAKSSIANAAALQGNQEQVGLQEPGESGEERVASQIPAAEETPAEDDGLASNAALMGKGSSEFKGSSRESLTGEENIANKSFDEEVSVTQPPLGENSLASEDLTPNAPAFEEIATEPMAEDTASKEASFEHLPAQPIVDESIGEEGTARLSTLEEQTSEEQASLTRVASEPAVAEPISEQTLVGEPSSRDISATVREMSVAEEPPLVWTHAVEQEEDHAPTSDTQKDESLEAGVVQNTEAMGQGAVAEPNPEMSTTNVTRNVENEDADEMWAPFTTKKKAKKGKKSKRSNAEPDANSYDAQDVTSTLEKAQVESVDQSAAATSTEVDEDPKDLTDGEQRELWPSLVKGKKSKKSKKATSPVTSITPMSTEEIAGLDKPQNQDMVQQSGNLPVRSDLAKDSPAVEPVDDWMTSSKGKKAKKGKKSKLRAAEPEFADVEETLQTSAIEQAPVPEADESASHPSTQHQQQSLQELPVANAALDMDVEEPPVPEDIEHRTTDSLPPLPESPVLDTLPDGSTRSGAASPLILPAHDYEYALEPSSEREMDDMDMRREVLIYGEHSMPNAAGTTDAPLSESGPNNEHEEPQHATSEPISTEKDLSDAQEAESIEIVTQMPDNIAHEETMDLERSSERAMADEGSGVDNLNVSVQMLSEPPSIEVGDAPMVTPPSTLHSTFGEQPQLPAAFEPTNPHEEGMDTIYGTHEAHTEHVVEAADISLPQSPIKGPVEDSQIELKESFVATSNDEGLREVTENDESIQGSDNNASAPELPKDLDFSEDVAKGLSDSGFDPSIVALDPKFQRRSFPPGRVAEADPEEMFAVIGKKNKKAKKGKKAFEAEREGAMEKSPEIMKSVDPAPPPDDFDKTLEAALVGTGFDTSFLQQAVSSSNDVSSNEVTGDTAEFTFSTAKRKKGKKSKRGLPTPTLEKRREVLSNNELDNFDTDIIASLEKSASFPQSTPHDDELQIDRRLLDTEQPETIDTQDTDLLVPPEPAISTWDASGVAEQISEGTETQDSGCDRQPPTETKITDLTLPLTNTETRAIDVEDTTQAAGLSKQNKRNKKKQKPTAFGVQTEFEPSSTGDELYPAESAQWAASLPQAELEPMSHDLQAPKPENREHDVWPIVDEQPFNAETGDVASLSSATSIVPNVFPLTLPADESRKASQSSVVTDSGGFHQPSETVRSATNAIGERTSPPDYRMDEEMTGHAAAVKGDRASTHITSFRDLDEEPDERQNIIESSMQPAAPIDSATVAEGTGLGLQLKKSEERFDREQTISTDNERELKPQATDSEDPFDIPSTWSFASLQDEVQASSESPLLASKVHEIARDSGYQGMDTPVMQRGSVESAGRAVHEIHNVMSRESLSSRRSAEPLRISTESESDWTLNVPRHREGEGVEKSAESMHHRNSSHETDDTPLESTTKNRASYLFQSTPENLKAVSEASESPTPSARPQMPDYFPTSTRDGAFSTTGSSGREDSGGVERFTFSPPSSGTMSPRVPLDSIPEEHYAQKRSVAETDAVEPDNNKALRRTQTPQSIRARERALSPMSLPPITIPSGTGRSNSNPVPTDEAMHRALGYVVNSEGTFESDRPVTKKSSRQVSADQRSPSVMSNRSNKSAGQFKSPEELRSYSRSSNRSSTPTLRRIDRSLSGDLRAASRRGEAGSAVGARSSPKTIPFEPPPTPPSNDDEVMDAGASRSVDMSDVYQGYGDAQASQVSPTRPPNMRKRQSMHIMDLESRLDQLVAENQALHEEKQNRSVAFNALNTGDDVSQVLQARDLQLHEKDNEISQIRAMLEPMQQEIARLTEINNGLTEANRNLVDDTNGRYATLQQEHAEAHEQWQSASRDLEYMRQEHGRLNTGMREIVEAEIAANLADKNSEIRQLREELDVASEQIRSLQVQIQSTKNRDFLTFRDEDYFDGACQKLCQHVQQWVLRFSKTSDNRVCRLSTELRDDKIEARLDNAILDGSDVDKLLGDRTRRRDVFMSVVMTMVWEYVFTRYLFGMDREQRQKLKSLEKILAEVGPPRAVAQWRATTLTLLARRPAFEEQRDLDTEAVANEIFGLLCSLLPPPSNAQQQLQTSLHKVIGIAVDLSIEMRTQRAEYIMLPPLQPEYDTNGDLVRKVHFNASLMNERSGMFSSNEELEESHAVVKIVLFPLVVKKGDEVGEGEEEIVVCPAQVLVHNENGKGKKIVRVQSGAMEIDDARRSRQSLLSPQQSTAF